MLGTNKQLPNYAKAEHIYENMELGGLGGQREKKGGITEVQSRGGRNHRGVGGR